MNHLLPPPNPAVAEDRRCEAVVTLDELVNDPIKGWVRRSAFWYDGEEYAYELAAFPAADESTARRKMYNAQVEKTLQETFLKEVHLDMTRPH